MTRHEHNEQYSPRPEELNIFPSIFNIKNGITFKVFIVEKSFKKQNSSEINFWISGTNSFVPSSCVSLFEPTLCKIFIFKSWSILIKELSFYTQNLSTFYFQLNKMISSVPCTLSEDLKNVFCSDISESNLFAAGNTDCYSCIAFTYQLLSFVNISIVNNLHKHLFRERCSVLNGYNGSAIVWEHVSSCNLWYSSYTLLSPLPTGASNGHIFTYFHTKGPNIPIQFFPSGKGFFCLKNGSEWL